MTPAERDREIRETRARLADAREQRAAIFMRFRRYCDMFRTLSGMCDAVMGDAAEQQREQAIPEGLPSTGELRDLLAELRTCTVTIAECERLLP